MRKYSSSLGDKLFGSFLMMILVVNLFRPLIIGMVDHHYEKLVLWIVAIVSFLILLFIDHKIDEYYTKYPWKRKKSSFEPRSFGDYGDDGGDAGC